MEGKCKLCLKNIADKKNSHIIPFFLIKSMVTPGQQKRTEADISYEISLSMFSKSYFGRDVNPEIIENNLGRSLTESDIEQNKNFFAQDYYLCTVCETKLSTIESIFVSDCFTTIRTNAQKPDYRQVKLSEHNSSVCKLLLISIFWRIFALRIGDIRVSASLVEKLRRILIKVLDRDQLKLRENLKHNTLVLQKYKMGISYYNTDESEAKGLFFFNRNKINPYLLHINGLTIIYYAYRNKDDRSSLNGDPYENIFKRKVITRTNKLVQINLDNNKIKEIQDQQIVKMRDQFINNQVFLFKNTWRQIFHIEPNSKTVQKYLNTLIKGPCAKAERYTIDRCSKIIHEIIQEEVKLNSY